MANKTETTRHDFKEFAAPPTDPWRDLFGGRRLSDTIARSEGYAGHSDPYSLFEEMEDKDAHLFSQLQTRKLGVLARPRKFDPGGDRPEDAEAAQWIGRTLAAIPGWNMGLLHLLDALGKGAAFLEVLWGFDKDGRIVPRELKPRAARRFVMDRAGRWRLLESNLDPLAPGKPLPARKFLISLFGATDERPYGKSLDDRVYWYWWFKKHNLKFWLIYNDKFGSPTVVARHRAGLGDGGRERLLEVIDEIQTDAGVTIPEGITLELLEASRSGSPDTYRLLAQWCNDEIARAVLGQTLTSGEGQHSGSLALGRVHEEVRRDYIRADACLLMDVINAQLVHWLIDLNFGADFPAPRWTIDVTPELDLESEVQIDRQLLQMGVSLPSGYFYEKYGRPVPTDASRGLQFDDSNLFQYHLPFGVLTINEVRAKLGLPPVAWGNQPTSPVDAGIRPPTPSGSTSEDPLEQEKEGEADRNRRRER